MLDWIEHILIEASLGRLTFNPFCWLPESQQKWFHIAKTFSISWELFPVLLATKCKTVSLCQIVFYFTVLVLFPFLFYLQLELEPALYCHIQGSPNMILVYWSLIIRTKLEYSVSVWDPYFIPKRAQHKFTILGESVVSPPRLMNLNGLLYATSRGCSVMSQYYCKTS